jgi:hypothetical protein
MGMRGRILLPALLIPVIALIIFGCAGLPERRSGADNPRARSETTANSELMSEESEIAESGSELGVKFYPVLEQALNKRGMNRAGICNEQESVQKRVLREYGALFLADASVQVPPTCMFTNEEDVSKFQQQAGIASEEMLGAKIELQPAAMKALLAAREEARSKGFDITPRDGAEAGKRGFADTLRLWDSRFLPACDHWVGKGKLKDEEVARLKSLPINEQVREVLELEKRGIYFNTFFNNSILYSVAAPGTSQHLSMLAIDINEFENKKIREIMGNHGWFRTVKNDSPHFTFLGVKAEDLRDLGLKKINAGGGDYWVPNV